MNDILPPNRNRTQTPQSPADPPVTSPPQMIPLEEQQSIADNEQLAPAPLAIPRKRSMPLGKRIGLIIGSILALGVLLLVGAFFWYQHQISPVSSDPKATRVRITIESGTTPDDIGSLLVEKKVIRDLTAFNIYTRLTSTRNKLQAGTFSLSPHESTATVVDHLVAGKTDQFSITFLPGATVAENKKVLLAAGYSQTEVDTAFKKPYDSPVFQGKPVMADLEGYIYGETYTFSAGSTVEQILQRTFDEFYAAIIKNDLIPGVKAQGLTLYQGIALASIIQSEMGAHEADMPQVAQVFLKRYAMGMPLGSDVTAYYGADKTGQPRSVAVDTPYNTRIHAGIPGAISSPGLAAIKAVAAPAAGDYLYFLTGDDQKNYFSTTNEQHEKNIVDHCKIGCAIP